MNKNLLLEIGVEEIPAQYVHTIMDSLKSTIVSKLNENNLEFEDVEILCSPRRLTARVKNLSDTQKTICEEVRGPSKQASFANEEPTRALLGFLNSKKKTLDDITFKDINGVSYVFTTITSESKPTMELLPKILVDVISSLPLPRSMRWGTFSFRFIRPIRWLLCLYKDQVVPFSIEDINSSNTTRGHRTLANKEIVVNDEKDYEKLLKENFVIVDLEERKNLILKQVAELEKKNDIKVAVTDSLLDEITNLVEYPTSDIGNFDKKYLAMPDGCVITPMRDHQRYFPVYKNGKLYNMFVYVRNGDNKDIQTVRFGNEKVLVARLEDAEFFYKEDRKHNLEFFASKLDEIVFREGLGTMTDKVERIKFIALELARMLYIKDTTKLEKAISLCKADLMTNMVNEFEELQGTMGMEYGKLEGLDEEITDAIGYHYYPRFSGDEMPKTLLASIISFSDKLDSILSSFAINVVPSGSADPFGLRRQALAVLNIVETQKWQFDLSRIIRYVVENYAKFNKDLDGLANKVIDFIKQRLKVQLTEKYGYNVADSILNSHSALNVTLIDEKVEAIKSLKANPKFEELKNSLVRIDKMIANKSVELKVDRELLKEKEEKELSETFDKVMDATAINISQIVNNYFMLVDSITNFFDNLLVLDKDEKIKQNRLNLLYLISSHTKHFIDICVIE